MAAVERIDLCVRVAGEKAKESDEFITLSQLVNGTNITRASNGDILIDFGAEEGYKTFLITGDGIETDFNVFHEFNTWDVAHEMYFVTSKRTFIGDFQRTDEDNATVSTAPYVLGLGEEIVCIIWNNFVTTSGTQTLSLVGSVLAISGGNDVTFTATNVDVDSSGFVGNLSTDIVTVQDALNEIDALVLGAAGGQTGHFDLMAYNDVLVTFATMALSDADKYYGNVKLSFYADSATNKASQIVLIHYTASIVDGTLSYNYDDSISPSAYSSFSGLRVSYNGSFEMELVGSEIQFKIDAVAFGADTVTSFYVDFAFDNMQSADVVVGSNISLPIDATDVNVDVTGFIGNLSTDIVNVQDALKEIDAMSLGEIPDGTVVNSTRRWDGTNWVENEKALSSSTGKIWSKGNVDIEASLEGGSSEGIVSANGSSAKDARLRASTTESRVHLRNGKSYVQLYNHVLGQSYEAIFIKERDGAFGADVSMFTVNSNGTIFSTVLTPSTLLQANASKEIVSVPNGLITYRAERTFTPAEILAFHTTRINLVEALGANVLADPQRIIFKYDYGTADYTGAAVLYIGDDPTATGVDLATMAGNSFISSYDVETTRLSSDYLNKALSIGATDAITGETATGTLTVIIYYTIEDFS